MLSTNFNVLIHLNFEVFWTLRTLRSAESAESIGTPLRTLLYLAVCFASKKTSRFYPASKKIYIEIQNLKTLPLRQEPVQSV